MPAPSRTAVTGNVPGWRCRNRLQGAGSPQLRSLCTAGGQTQWGQLLAATCFLRVRGLQGERLGDPGDPGQM